MTTGLPPGALVEAEEAAWVVGIDGISGGGRRRADVPLDAAGMAILRIAPIPHGRPAMAGCPGRDGGRSARPRPESRH